MRSFYLQLCFSKHFFSSGYAQQIVGKAQWIFCKGKEFFSSLANQICKPFEGHLLPQTMPSSLVGQNQTLNN
jgi:hypothetical protein